MNQEPKPLSKEEIRKTSFRVTCLNPAVVSGAIKLEGRNRLCGYGTGMTIEEMNENLIWKGRPYIRIPYCKGCYTENTVGVFDDTPQILGWAVLDPREDDPIFHLVKLSKEAFNRMMKELR